MSQASLGRQQAFETSVQSAAAIILLLWDECIATEFRCSMKISKHVRAPTQTKDDCHQSRPLVQAITNLIVERAKAGLITKTMKVK